MPSGSPKKSDPRIARTRQDLLDTTTTLLMQGGWEYVSYVEVARRAGYSRATIYAHWPNRLDLIRDAVNHICAHTPQRMLSGQLQEDLVTELAEFSADLLGRWSRMLSGAIAGDHDEPILTEMRRQLYDAKTLMLRSVLQAHLPPGDVEPVLALLTGGVFVLTVLKNEAASDTRLRELVDRALSSTAA